MWVDGPWKPQLGLDTMDLSSWCHVALETTRQWSNRISVVLFIYLFFTLFFFLVAASCYHIHGLGQERCNSIASALELHLSCTNPSILKQKQNDCHFPDDIFKCIFINGKLWILIIISLKFVPYGTINNMPALVQIMSWQRLGNKPLSEPMTA